MRCKRAADSGLSPLLWRNFATLGWRLSDRDGAHSDRSYVTRA